MVRLLSRFRTTGPMRGDLLTIIETPQGGGLRRLRNPMIA